MFWTELSGLFIFLLCFLLPALLAITLHLTFQPGKAGWQGREFLLFWDLVKWNVWIKSEGLDWAALGQDTRGLLVNLTPHIFWNHRNCLWDVGIMKRSCIASPPGCFLYKWKCGISGTPLFSVWKYWPLLPQGPGWLLVQLPSAGRRDSRTSATTSSGILGSCWLALFSKLLLSDWWLCRCYESSKEALLKGTSDAKGKLSPPPPLPASGSAVLAWLMLHLLNHAKPPVWRGNGKEGLADSPYKQMLTATQS